MEKLIKLRRLLKEKQIEAFLITNPYNVRYMTGFTGTSGLAIVNQEEAIFVTDFRYTEQASAQVKDFQVVELKKSFVNEVAKIVENLHIKTLAFEQDTMTYSAFEVYRQAISADFVGISNIIEEIRLIKSTEEIKIIKVACEIADAAFDHIQKFIRPGKTELQVSNELEFFMRQQGATASSFDTIVASGIRSALPHGVATDKIIEKGDFVTLDYGALYNGYISDTTRTIAVGQPSEKLKEIYDIVLQAQLKGVAALKPGMTGFEADAITRDYITKHGYGEAFGHSTGHGIGLEVHEAPNLSKASTYTLAPNMVVTCEPGIYLPGIGGVRIEDDVLITENGCETLTHATKELIIL